MSTTTEKPVKAKKDKSSKKRKSQDVTEPAPKSPPQAGTEESPSNDIPTNLSTAETESLEPPKKKRKSSIPSEIEVDIDLPEPPSKKALRRLKKGKPLPPSRSGADSTPEPETTTTTVASKKSEAEKRSEHGIWIGNLPWSVMKDDLRKFLTDNSELVDEDITRIHMPGPEDGKPANKVEETRAWKKQHNKGFAYVDFSTAEAVEQAVELSEQLLQGRRVLIKNHKSFEGRPMKTKEESRAETKAPSKRVFVGNLRFDATEDSVREHFERCGPVEHIMLATFEDSGKCKGYGWITFEELEAAEAAVRGWVRVEQTPESDEESSSSSEEEASDGEAEQPDAPDAKSAAKIRLKKPIFKKHYIDKIHMRPVRREFAEAPQIRYKKRYGKDGTKSRLAVDEDAGAGAGADGEAAGTGSARPRPVKAAQYREDYASRLTGSIVESQGKKVVF
ncbi:MAG: hypothetical protein M1818_002641 [Claussenomyces sp. TS43310]|nr:MAG: hypothetical protein M1818_002641 [Claussenomyces sp. TS43310]